MLIESKICTLEGVQKASKHYFTTCEQLIKLRYRLYLLICQVRGFHQPLHFAGREKFRPKEKMVLWSSEANQGRINNNL
jgi:hypothetical protein